MRVRETELGRLVDDRAAGRIDRRTFMRRAAALGLSVPAGAFLAACGGTSATGAEAGRASKTLRVRLSSDVQNMDPATYAAVVDEHVFTNVFEGLVTYKPGTFEVVNQLAESFTPADDHLTYDFTIKKGVQFHGGYGEVTAHDVKFSYERIAGLARPKIESPYVGDWAALKEVKVKDRYSGSIVLKRPFSALMATTLPTPSGMVVSRKAVEKLGKKHATHPIGTGPYEFVNWSPKQQVVLRRFTDYRTGFVRPQWQEIVLRPIEKDSAADIALQTGDVDFGELSLQGVDRFNENSAFDVTDRFTLGYNFIGMNMRHPKLRDINVRRAIRLAIDVPGILAAAFDGKFKRATAVIPPAMKVGYWKDAPVYARDVAQAKQLLAGASSAPTELSIMYIEETGADDLVQIVQANLKEIGIAVKARKVESAVFYDLGKSLRERELFYVGYGTQPDPSWSTEWFTCDQIDEWNWMYWCDENFDRLHHAALKEFDAARRNEMYIEMQQRWDAAAHTVWTHWPTYFFGWRKGLKPSISPHGRIQCYAFTA